MIVYIVHEHDSGHGGQAGEAPWSLYGSLHESEQQIGYESDPYLYLDGIGAFSVEITKGEVLFDLFETNYVKLLIICLATTK